MEDTDSTLEDRPQSPHTDVMDNTEPEKLVISENSPPNPASINGSEKTPDGQTPASRKRSTSDRSDGSVEAEPAAKRLRVEESFPEPENFDNLITAVVDQTPKFADGQWQLLQRSTAMILEHIGFDSASKEALEMLCAEADSYATKFLSFVTESMLSARRAQPTPMDFEYALRRDGLTDRLLRPHLNPPLSPGKTTFVYEASNFDEVFVEDNPIMLSEELSGASEKLSKRYIPKAFPEFPSKHTYKATEVMTEREKDPRKIREKATEAARHGEEALRRLVKIGKAGDNKGVKRASEKSAKHWHKHELWEKTMEELGRIGIGTTDKEAAGDEQSILVDAGKQYKRKTPSKVRV